MPPSSPSSGSYQRTIEVFLSPEPEGAQRAVAAIKDPVHHMKLLAQVQPNGTLTNACVADRSHPFDECRQAIARSGEVWNEVDLRNGKGIHAVMNQLDGCAHITELVRYLAFAFQKEIKHLRLQLTTALETSPLNVRLTMDIGATSTSRLGIAMPKTGSGFNIRPGEIRITEADDPLERLLKDKSPEDGLKTLRSNGESSGTTEEARLLLRFFRETAGAILVQGLEINLHTLRGAIRAGRTPMVECALFKDLIHPSDES